MCHSFRMLFVLGYFLQWSTVQAEMNIHCIPGSSVSLSGVDEEQKNKAEFFQWKLTHGNTDIPVLQFHKGDTRPPLLKKYDGRLDVFPFNGSFVLHNLTASDQGLYTLHINLQNVTVQAIRLWVIDELSNPSIFSNSTFIASTIMLTCNVSGQPHEYRWQKDGGNISQHHQRVDGNRSLIIPNAGKDDCGTYTCVVINPVSSVWADYTVTIFGIPQEQYIIVVASVVGLVLSAASFTGQIVQCCLNKQLSQQVRIQRIAKWVYKEINIGSQSPLIFVLAGDGREFQGAQIWQESPVDLESPLHPEWRKLDDHVTLERRLFPRKHCARSAQRPRKRSCDVDTWSSWRREFISYFIANWHSQNMRY
ncbi:vascular endothelial growth factor receptor 2-like [Rhincodon typus]|uniref:vascular endothelial growth factor receptor 2-like n=1 Tax=Rhincodon typus TaxID=259920 RepID=UPI00202E40EC|nr:vascular endothelial growth factor receptor 2-like [Rhincodon typus]